MSLTYFFNDLHIILQMIIIIENFQNNLSDSNIMKTLFRFQNTAQFYLNLNLSILSGIFRLTETNILPAVISLYNLWCWKTPTVLSKNSFL